MNHRRYHPGLRMSLPDHRKDAIPSRALPNHQREPRRRNNGWERNAVEPILLATGSNDRVPDASPNRSHPILW